MKIVPHAWKDKPALIEVAFPAQKISIEAQCERKSNAGQTLTSLGSYWKGRKPLVLVRASVLGSLLPATGDTERDLEIFEMLMGIDDDAFVHRVRKVSQADVEAWGGTLASELIDDQGHWKLRGRDRDQLLGRVLARMPYDQRLQRRSKRPEELPDEAYAGIWKAVNEHLGTKATSHAELIEQLGLLRFGHRPRVGDSFCGGGSIPFEAARLGCDVYASDLNPIATMLTWAALNVVGGSEESRRQFADGQASVVSAVEAELAGLGVECDSQGNRAKAHLYCLEARCPETGWLVPLSTSWVISKNRRTIARLQPNAAEKRFEIDICSDASDEDLGVAARGTVRDGHLVYELEGIERRIPIRTLRGDRRSGGQTVNEIRPWTASEIVPRSDDLFVERLYCIQWVARGSGDIFYTGIRDEDRERELLVEGIVSRGLTTWQAEGLVPNMAIETGAETARLLRERGWTQWHQLFPPRHLLYWSLLLKHARALLDDHSAAAFLATASNALDRSSKLGQWRVGFPGRPGVAPSSDRVEHVFYNQALNVFFNYGIRLFSTLAPVLTALPKTAPIAGRGVVAAHPAGDVGNDCDIFITDPPYADAVNYDEITEYFISWYRGVAGGPFAGWVWDSRRDLAIRGSGEDFRVEMVKAYTALANHMPDNGMQIVMFTHQDAKVWGDMAGIFWAAGLRVTAAWYIATETTSELKKGGYVQGTVILVLRKRTETKKAYKDELVLEVREEVKKQLETMVGLNQQVRARGRSENLFEDADLQMAGYAAALRVLTGCTAIDGIDMTREALRPRTEGERTIVDELIEFAVAIANEELVPDGLDAKVWEKLVGVERFYLRMLDLEAAGLKKLDNYQNFAKAFRVGDWQPLMGSMKPNDARLKSAREFKRAEFGQTEFGGSLLRAVLYALYELEAELETDEVMSHLRDNVTGYYSRRADIVAVASYLAGKLERIRDDEAGAARVLRDLVKGERLGA